MGLQGSEAENETMSQLESYETLFLSGFKICKIWKTCTDLMDINRINVNVTLACTLGDISYIVFPYNIKNNYFLSKSCDLLRGKKTYFLLF